MEGIGETGVVGAEMVMFCAPEDRQENTPAGHTDATAP